jgi:23S rRNA pseudouridine2605 synthase
MKKIKVHKTAPEDKKFDKDKVKQEKFGFKKENTTSDNSKKKDDKKSVSQSKKHIFKEGFNNADNPKKQWEKDKPQSDFDKKNTQLGTKKKSYNTENIDFKNKKKPYTQSENSSFRKSYKNSENEYTTDKKQWNKDKNTSGTENKTSYTYNKNKSYTKSEEGYQKENKNFPNPYQNFGGKKNAKKLARKMLKHHTANVTNLKTQLQTLKKLQQLPDNEVRLNRYIAHCGICARRDADLLIKSGKIKVNGEVVTELGKKINPEKDIVEFEGKRIEPQKFVYILMNKPKDCLCTLKDPEGRRTVLDIIDDATPDRVFPVGRLDRNTIGLLLLTNDGELAQRLMHPSYEIPKIYQVTLNESFQRADMEAIRKGITLEDGLVHVDNIDYIPDTYRKQLIIQIHSGKNRVIRRIFEHLEYEVEKLDRVMYAGLDKKALPRGKYRFLNEEEIQSLKKLVRMD